MRNHNIWRTSIRTICGDFLWSSLILGSLQSPHDHPSSFLLCRHFRTQGISIWFFFFFTSFSHNLQGLLSFSPSSCPSTPASSATSSKLWSLVYFLNSDSQWFFCRNFFSKLVHKCLDGDLLKGQLSLSVPFSYTWLRWFFFVKKSPNATVKIAKEFILKKISARIQKSTLIGSWKWRSFVVSALLHLYHPSSPPHSCSS